MEKVGREWKRQNLTGINEHYDISLIIIPRTYFYRLREQLHTYVVNRSPPSLAPAAPAAPRSCQKPYDIIQQNGIPVAGKPSILIPTNPPKAFSNPQIHPPSCQEAFCPALKLPCLILICA
jgi:hypothetical protein